MVVGILIVDLLLGDVRSLKEKRAVVRPLVAELRRRFEVAAAETGYVELRRRTEISAAVLSSTHRHAVEVLDECERLLTGHPELQVVGARQRVLDDEDLS